MIFDTIHQGLITHTGNDHRYFWPPCLLVPLSLEKSSVYLCNLELG